MLQYIQQHNESTAPVCQADVITDVALPLFLAAPIRCADEPPTPVGNAAERVRHLLDRYRQFNCLHGASNRRLWIQGSALEWIESQFQGWTEEEFSQAQQELFRRGDLVRASGDPRVLTALSTTHNAEVTH